MNERNMIECIREIAEILNIDIATAYLRQVLIQEIKDLKTENEQLKEKIEKIKRRFNSTKRANKQYKKILKGTEIKD